MTNTLLRASLTVAVFAQPIYSFDVVIGKTTTAMKTLWTYGYGYLK